MVPTPVDGGRVITELSVIMFGLEETEPSPSLLPDDPLDARAYTAMDEAGRGISPPGCITVTLATADRKYFLVTMTPWEREARYARNSNWERGEIWRDCIEMVPEAPRVEAAIRHYDAAFDDMERKFCETAWLGGRDFGFADNCMIPYEKRLSMIYMDSLCTRDRPNVTECFERMEARPSYENAVLDCMTGEDHE